MKKSTLTLMLGLIFLFAAVIMCWPQLDENKSKTTQATTTAFPTKTRTSQRVVADAQKPITITFGIRANFDQPNNK